jgi:Tfp pilus assembly protein PilF
MSDLPPAWESFYGRARDNVGDGDLDEARWSAERALFYLKKLEQQNNHAEGHVLRLLQEIATLQGDRVAASVYGSQATLLEKQKSLWQHLREG